MKAADLRKLAADELEARIRELRDQVFNQRIKHATGQLADTASLRKARRDLARSLTVRAEREESR
jgi:large subunit ribosomal protein L29